MLCLGLFLKYQKIFGMNFQEKKRYRLTSELPPFAEKNKLFLQKLNDPY